MQNKKIRHKWAVRLASFSLSILLMCSFGLSVMAQDSADESSSKETTSSSSSSTPQGDSSAPKSEPTESTPAESKPAESTPAESIPDIGVPDVGVPQPDKISIIAFDALEKAIETQKLTLLGLLSQDEEVNLPASLAATTAESTPVTIEGITWACANFDPTTAGRYTFAPTLPEAFVLAQGVAAPAITVILREDTPAAAPMPLAVNDVMVTAVPSTTAYQTFTNLDNKTKPQNLTVNLSVAVQPGLTAAQVEIPLAYRPTAASHPNFVMTEDIFTLVEPINFPAGSIFSGYTVQPGSGGAPDTLVLTINDNLLSAGAESIALRFAFNDIYNSKIDTGNSLWNVQATASVGGIEVYADTPTDIKTSAITQITYTPHKFVPVDNLYTGGTLNLRASTLNLYWYQAGFDPTYTNIIYIEVPTGTLPGAIITDYYKDGIQTNATNPDVPVGYERYYKKVKNVSGDWNIWHYMGQPFSVFSQKDIRIMPPSTLAIGSTFNIRLGADYRKINGAVRKTDKITEYVVSAQKPWHLYYVGYHSTGDSFPATVDTTPGSVGTAVNASYSHFMNTAATKNLGTQDITDVSLVLNQASTASGKVNFNEIYAQADHLDTTYPLAYFRWDYTIKNANGSTPTTHSTAAVKGIHKLALPTLAAGQYLDDITLIPMGTDGLQEGVLPTKNSIAIRYTTKAWDNKKWPDETDVPYHTPVPLEWTFNYRDDPAKGGAMVSKPGNKINIYYTSATGAHANVVSGNATGKKPGETVRYEIQGYNRRLHAIGTLQNPRVVVAVPKALELQDPAAPKDFIDKKDNSTATGCVEVSLVSDTPTHNYYAFQAMGVEASIQYGVPSFIIPLTFKVADGTKEGKYPILAAATTSDTPATFQNVENTLMDNLPAHETNMGLGGGKKYAGQAEINHTPLTVVSALKLATETTIQSVATGAAWSAAAVVPAQHNETVKMKITLDNAGNTTFTNVRIYNILPASGDGRGSTGNISFAGLEATGATVWHTTNALGSLPAYKDVNLSNGKPSGVTWAQGTAPANATAVYLDFGNTEVTGGQKLGVEMKFAIPASGNQTAYNNFQYYAKEVSQAATEIKSVGSMAGFSTEAIALLYDENLPTPLPGGVTAASNMPTDHAGIFGFVQGNKFTVSSTVPTLTGYAFVEWQDATTPAKKYTGGEEIVFAAAGTVTLKAIWKSAPSTLIFHKNGGDTEANPGKKNFAFDHTLIASDLPTTNPTRAGHTFEGWATTSTAATANFGEGSKIDFSNAKTVYAVWKAIDYTLTYNGNGHTGGTMANATVTYDTNFTLAPNSYTKTGDTFRGWATSKANADAGTVAYPDGHAFSPWKFSSNQTIYAVWKTPTSTVVYNGNGHTSGTMANGTATKGTNFTLAANGYSKTGCTFKGWNTDKAAADAGSVEHAAGKTFSPWTQAAGMTLYAVWETSKTSSYTLTFNAQGGTPEPNAQVLKPMAKAQKPADPSKAGYGFVGWFDAPTSGAKWDFDTNTMPAKNITLHAQYVVIKYNVTFHYGGAKIKDRTISVDYAALIAKPKNPSWAGKAFQGWKGEDGKAWDFAKNTMPAKNITITAVWDNVSYTVKFVNWDNAKLKTQTVGWNKNATPPAKPARAGWTFTRWSGNYTNVTKNETVKAVFTQNPVTSGTSSSGSTPTPGTTASSSSRAGGGTTLAPTPPVDTGTTTTSPAPTRGTGTAASGSGAGASSTSRTDDTNGAKSAPQSEKMITSLEDDTVPLADAAREAWSLLSLLIALASLCMTIYLTLSVFRKRKTVVLNEAGQQENSNKLNFNVFRIVSILAGVLTILLFFIFNNIANPMVFVNRWTLLLLATFIVHILFNILGYRKGRSIQEDDDDTVPI